MREVAIARGQTASMIDDNQLAVTILPADEGDGAAGSCDHRVTRRGVDVLSRMKLVRTATKGISSSTKSAFQLSNHWPDRRSVTTLSQDIFIGSHFAFELAHFA